MTLHLPVELLNLSLWLYLVETHLLFKKFLDLVQSSKICHLLICHSFALQDQCSECALIFNKTKVISVKLAKQWRKNNVVIGYIFHFLLHLLCWEHIFAYLRMNVFSDLGHLFLSFLSADSTLTQNPAPGHSFLTAKWRHGRCMSRVCI